jgi:hypothetical protein
MRNETRARARHAALARGLLAFIVGAASGALAEDTTPPVQPAPAQTAPTPTEPTKEPAGKPASAPATTQGADGDDQGADYEKNAAKRFTPTERTPADRNVSFPVDI